MKKKAAPVMVFLAGTLWGSMGIFVRQFQAKGLDSIDIVAIRAITTSGIMLLFLTIYDRSLLKIKWRDIWCFIGTGICSITFFNYCYFKAIMMTSMSVAAVLLYTAPAIVMILSRILFKEKFTVIKAVSLAVTFAGCVLVTGIVGEAQALSAGGILVGLGAGLGYALYSIFSRFALERGYHSFTISFYTFLIALAGVVPLADMRSTLRAAGDSISMIAFSIVFGLISTVLPYVLYTIGLKSMENGKASIIASVEPVVATLLGILLFHETMTIGGLAGMLLVIGAIVMCNVHIPKK